MDLKFSFKSLCAQTSEHWTSLSEPIDKKVSIDLDEFSMLRLWYEQ